MGWQITAEVAIGFGFRGGISYVLVYRYAFRTSDLKQPLQASYSSKSGCGSPSAQAGCDAA